MKEDFIQTSSQELGNYIMITVKATHIIKKIKNLISLYKILFDWFFMRI